LTDTYDRRIQLGASRRRFEDAEILHNQKRWTGAIYMGGYAIECNDSINAGKEGEVKLDNAPWLERAST
jgi:hypothetical protein